MAERWGRVRELFARAHALPPAERADLLEAECGDDDELRAEVQGLLDTAHAAPDFLETPAPAATDLASVLREGPSEALLGERIGSYRIGRILASGGMGVVFEAEQEHPRRKVALKMMKLGFDSPDAAQRFRYEVEVLGRLRHPGIAQVYDTGIHRNPVAAHTRELPWFAMEFVEDAQPIGAYARERGLGIEDRLRLFAQVCDAVHHGHQRGVIHRDLKPDNILVDAQGRPKVIDFGVARATEADRAVMTRMTRAGAVIGTLRFMSPEQVAGDDDAVDARSDVYSLGVVLYELLTGQLPHDLGNAPLHEVARIIREQPPRRPTLLRPDLDRDLELIVLEALAVEPERRYASAAALAADVTRFLRHEPIDARPPTLSYHLRMFARRHRAAVTAAALVIVTAIAAAVISTQQAVRAGRAETAERTAKERATALFSSLLDLSTSSVFEFAHRLRDIEGTIQLRVDVLAKAVDNLEHLHELAPDDPAIRTQLAQAHCELGEVYGSFTFRNIGERQKAVEEGERALALIASLVEAAPDDIPLKRLGLQARTLLANIAYGALDHDRAVPLLEENLAVLTELEAADPDYPDYPMQISGVLERVGSLKGAQRDHAAALAHFNAARDALERGLARQPEPHVAHRKLSINHLKRGAALAMLERLDEAIEAHQLSVREAEAAYEASPESAGLRAGVAGSHLGLANVLRKAGRADEAEPSVRAALTVFDSMLEDDPENVRLRQNRVIAQMQLGDVFRVRAGADSDAESWRQARTWYQSALAGLEALQAEGKLARVHQELFELIRKGLAECDAALRDG